MLCDSLNAFTRLTKRKTLSTSSTPSIHTIPALKKDFSPNGIWEKAPWRTIEALSLTHFMGKPPTFQPCVQAKLAYTSTGLYVIFRVEDQFIAAETYEPNGPVWRDSCVEFFFSPLLTQPEAYFNIEINCCGIPYAAYQPRLLHNVRPFDSGDFQLFEIAAQPFTRPLHHQIQTPTTWTIEYKIPFIILEKYSQIVRPEPGVAWRANFYKIAEVTSDPHYITWAPINNPNPDFHRVDCFGRLIFL